MLIGPILCAAAFHGRDAFDWWSGIWIPLFAGILTVLVAGASLLIAVFALREAKLAKRSTRARERAEQAQRLQSVAMDSAQGIIDGETSDAWDAVRNLSTAFSLAGADEPVRMCAQLIYWLMYAGQHSPDTDLRWAIATDILSELQKDVWEYAKDDTETTRHKSRNIDDIEHVPPAPVARQ